MHMRIIYIVSLAWMLLVSSCDSFRDVKGVEDVASMSVAVNIQLDVENLAEIKDLTLKFDNYDEDLHLSQKCAVGKVEMDGVIPGIYTITVSGTVLNADGDEFYVNGNLVNKALFGNVNEVDVMTQGLKVSPLVFKEIMQVPDLKQVVFIFVISFMRFIIIHLLYCIWTDFTLPI